MPEFDHRLRVRMDAEEASQQRSDEQRVGTRPSRIRHIAFDAQAVELVAETLGVTSATAPFRLPSGAVYQILVPDKEGRPAVMLTLWPSIRRVDAIAPAATVVFTDVM